MPTDPTEQRRSLRAAGRLARSRITGTARTDATAAIVARLLALPEVTAAERVLVTAAVGDELDLGGLRRRLAAAGTTVALPVVDGPDLVAVDVAPDTPLVPGWRDVPEPRERTATGSVDVAVVPALVLDRHGRRLGYGGGHFDRWLAGPGRGATTVGAVFHAQLVEVVPTREHDVDLDVVVTEAGTWRGGVAVPP
jgi:5-formyltetrahydrofolate cyclo-ligase